MNSVFSFIRQELHEFFEHKREIKRAQVNAKIERLNSMENPEDQKWEIKEVDSAGIKDDVLFYAIIFMFVWAGFDPVGAEKFFNNINLLPDWFVKTWFWLITTVLGIKKASQYAPKAFKEIHDIIKKS